METGSRRKIVEKEVFSNECLAEHCQFLRMRGEKIVLMSGCFDILHVGHLDAICDASEYGNLVIGINSDVFVKKLKGENRPIRDERERASLMAGFKFVQAVTIFTNDCELIRCVKPDYYIASMTSHIRIWEDEERVNLLRELGSEIVEFGLEKKNSTTRIIKIILNVEI
jgi:D-beta-D-heptose 7-phosphate kinase/D-beta-D-heptose 1-phosphate adenosyltransferase